MYGEGCPVLPQGIVPVVITQDIQNTVALS